MSAVASAWKPRLRAVPGELAKLPAFVRRDFLVSWSYRMAFFSEWFTLALQALLFYFISRLVDDSHLPTYGGRSTSYLEFVAIGVVVSGFVQLALHRVATGLREEQMLGTLESLMVTPTTSLTIQIGTVVYDLVYIPLRTVIFLGIMALAFGLDLDWGGFPAALVVLLAFIPFVWGAGIANAGLLLTFRRGSGAAGFAIAGLTVFSGAYFPLDLLPDWIEPAARLNPIALALEGMREPLLGGTGWSSVGGRVAALVPASLGSLLVGLLVFRAAVARERRKGSLGLY